LVRIKTIYKRGIKYYYFDIYDTWKEANKLARYYKKKNRSKYIIIKTERSYWFPTGNNRYILYLSKVKRLSW